MGYNSRLRAKSTEVHDDIVRLSSSRLCQIGPLVFCSAKRSDAWGMGLNNFKKSAMNKVADFVISITLILGLLILQHR